jgi:hypothetical protein
LMTAAFPAPGKEKQQVAPTSGLPRPKPITTIR